jgi:hypothetical protein
VSSQPPAVADAIALVNRRIEVLGTDLYKVTQEMTDAVDVMVGGCLNMCSKCVVDSTKKFCYQM